jgi:type VI secretion system protein ImpL
MMATLRRILGSHWLITGLGALALAAVIWWLGPLVAFGTAEPWRPLDPIHVRLWVLALIALLWLSANALRSWLTWRRNRAMLQALAPDPGELAKAGERDAITRNFERTLERLAKHRFAKADGRLLTQLPWYLLIGPPGSGKTTALLNSGLDFPLDDAHEIQGIGGTRHCDWFFTDEAVLIDTAGRYTVQDLDAERDRGGWQAFLELLAKHRPRQPINGVLVALAVTDLMGDGDAATRLAERLRERLQELRARLGLGFPVYLVLTKADLIGGFTEFFEGLEPAARAQVWGTTFPEPDTRVARRGFAADWQALIERLAARRLARLESERDPERAARVLGFPGQLTLLGPAVERFTAALFADLDDAVWWRGVYLTSGTQEGTPVDRLIGRIAAGFGVAPRTGRGPAVRSAPYFLTDLLRRVVFPEAGLVAENTAYARRTVLGLRLAWGTAGLALLVTAGLWTWSYSANAARSAATAQALVEIERQTPGLRAAELLATDDDVRAVLPALDALRDLPTGVADTAGESWRYRFGLSQYGRTASDSQSAYQAGLYRLLLPRLLAGLERELRGGINDPDFVFEALRSYLLIGNRERLVNGNPEQRELDSWRIMERLDAGFEGRLTSDERERLFGHVEALLAMPLDIDQREVAANGSLRYTPKIALDGALIGAAQTTLRALPLERRAYQYVRDDPVFSDLAPLRFADFVPGSAELFVRRSGQPLDTGIPALFSYPAFHGLGLDYGVLEAIDAAVNDVADDAWVLGRDGPLPAAERLPLIQATRELYYRDYIRTWDNELADIRLRPLADPERSVETLLILSRPEGSPLVQWIEGVLAQVRLTELPEDEAGEAEGVGLPAGVGRLAGRVAGQAASRLGGAGKGALRVAKLARSRPGGAAAGGAVAAVPGQPVEDHFRDLAVLVEGVGGATPPLQQALASLDGAYRQLNEVLAAARSGQPIPQGTAATQLDRVAQNLPSPLGEMLGGVAQTTAVIGAGTARAQIDARWQADVVPFCRQALGGRFPFDGSSSVDVNVDDFSRLFAPGGLIDRFFEQHLRPWVDTAQRPWRWRDADGQGLGISTASLATFERAARIRDSLFAVGSTPAANFQLTPLELDPRAEQVRLDVDGQVVEYRHGPQIPSQLRWPGPAGTSVVRLSVAPIGGVPLTVSREGPWSWFRLLRTGQMSAGSVADRFTVAFQVDGYRASFALAAGSVANPFDRSLFQGFQCPGAL